MEHAIENLMVGLRWLLLPLYLALIVGVFAIYGMAGKELWHLLADFTTLRATDLVLLLLALLDLVLVANLLVMVAIASYESYISRIEVPRESSPEWLGKLDASNVKVKVAVAVVMISMIHLLQVFMEGAHWERLLPLAAVHAVFVLSAAGIALVDCLHRPAH